MTLCTCLAAIPLFPCSIYIYIYGNVEHGISLYKLKDFNITGKLDI